jgi:hypothetical protein
MMSASIKKDTIIKGKVDAATAVIEKAKELAMNKPAAVEGEKENA